jgi:hypothetical protein
MMILEAQQQTRSRQADIPAQVADPTGWNRALARGAANQNPQILTRYAHRIDAATDPYGPELTTRIADRYPAALPADLFWTSPPPAPPPYRHWRSTAKPSPPKQPASSLTTTRTRRRTTPPAANRHQTWRSAARTAADLATAGAGAAAAPGWPGPRSPARPAPATLTSRR